MTLAEAPATPTDLERLYTDPTYEPTLEEWNFLVHKMGGIFVPADRDSCFRPLGGQ